MPRTHVTIWGAPKPMEIPRMAPSAQPQLIRFAIAMPPSTMTKMIATGVSQASRFDCNELAPVKNGEVCAIASSGAQIMASSKTADAKRQSERSDMSDLRLECVHFILAAPPRKLFALRSSGRTEAEILDYI